MPVLVLACRMCPKNIEATMYAMLMSTINFGILTNLTNRINDGIIMGCIIFGDDGSESTQLQ